MKKFKELLKEFKQPPSGSGPLPTGGNPHVDVLRFMDTNPFSIRTRQGDHIHFDSSLDAARLLSMGMYKHQMGQDTASETETPHMEKYFDKSVNTHLKHLGTLEDYIKYHPHLPEHLIPHVSSAINSIAEDQASELMERRRNEEGKKDIFGRDLSDIGSRIISQHHHHPIEFGDDSRHPYEDDEGRHLEDIMGEIEDSQETPRPLGFVNRREEHEEM